MRRLCVIVLAMGVALQWVSWNDRRQHGGQPAPRLVVDLNDSPAPVLHTLPKFGPARVEATLQARRTRPFRSLDDFDDRVRGIGPSTRKALEPFVRITPHADVLE